MLAVMLMAPAGGAVAGGTLTRPGEIFVTSMAASHMRTLVDRHDQPTHVGSTHARGIDTARSFTGGDTLPSTARHLECDDVDNDGRFDLYDPKRNVKLMPDHSADNSSSLLIGLPSATELTAAPGTEESGIPLSAIEPDDPASCVRTADPDKSVARLWDEALLDAIRRDFPAPTVHARNLYHMSAAMWDAWAAYEPVADGVFVTQKLAADDPTSAREEAISYAAYRVLSHRYREAAGRKASLRRFDELMAALCYPVGKTRTKGDTPAALGNRIAARIIKRGLKDGSRERQGYYSKAYAPLNEPMIVQLPGTVMPRPNHWQPLALEVAYTQNGQLLPVGPQEFIGPHWGDVTAFALPEPVTPGLPIDPGGPPRLGDPASDAEFKAKAIEVARFSSLLDPRDGVMVDISPASWGNAPLGSNDMAGHAVNPVTGQPYEAVEVLRADFGRVLAEFWADGPESETPPGHWNTLANSVSDASGFERRIGGVGEPVDALEWDVKLYLALNGALHDAAVAAWGAKGHHDYVRPISMIRWMSGLGQSSDPDLPSYHPDGLPLVEGEVELITKASTAAGERHAHLAEHVGEIAIRAWSFNPADTERELGGVDWNPRGRVGAVPARDVRDALVRGLRQRPLHVQPGRGRGAGRDDRLSLLPGGPRDVDGGQGLAQVRDRP